MTFDDEKVFEQAVINQLIESGWESKVLRYPTEQDLINNWAQILFNNNRHKDSLNDVPLTETEMQQILDQITNLRTPVRLNDFINGKSVSIKRDNPLDQAHFGQEVSLKIYDRREIAFGESRYQIAQQPQFKTKKILNDRRGDLMLLINGMPVIHMELKKSGVSVSRAYGQIRKYAHEGVFTGLFSLIQVFVAMEPAETVYFANPGPDGEFNKAFYFHWADFDNEPINDWKDVVSRLLYIPMAHTLIGFYSIADSKDDTLKVMRSYQYYAATQIATKVSQKDWNDREILGGHVWHTTGSGKTLTSFKSAQLIASWHDADKAIFLVDRKALGRQSFDDYRAFASPSEVIQDTADTEVLTSKLASDASEDTLIITSIQKLSNVTKDNDKIRTSDLEKIMSKRIVIIVDEAHRSTFGEMLRNIKDTFIHAIIFGFTGTPIQDVNSKKDNTTVTVFGDELHRYTLADGIRDHNVLGFDPYMVKIYDDYELREKVALMKAKAEKVEDVFGDKKKEKVYYKYMDSTKIKMVGEQSGKKYVKGIEDYVPNSQYETKEYRMAVLEDILKKWTTISHNNLFHAILATSSIPEAVQYYKLLKDMAPDLKVTAVFDPAIDDESGRSLDKEDGIFEMLEDYEEMFSQPFTMASYDKFREDVQLRLAHKKPYRYITKDQQIDLLIVVNQMLTGFDSKWINALYLDKVMEYENLIQAFSRTNRLYGDEKPFGTIKYYRRPNTMQRNIAEAVRAYSGDVPTGLFVDKLPGNLRTLNRLFDEISDLYASAGILNFDCLPTEKSERAKFAKLFKQFNVTLEAAQIQGFSWNKDTYTEIVNDTEEYIPMHFDQMAYSSLLQRYKELSGGGGGGMGEEPPFEIDTHITEINTDAIDADYMNSRFDKFYKLLQQGEYDEESLERTLGDLHKSFSMLSQEDQRYANQFIHDVQSGNIVVDPDTTFRDYISDYMKRAEEARIARVVRRLGCYAALLRDLLNRKVTEANINEFGRFDELILTVDNDKARAFFIVVEKKKYRDYRLKMLVDRYLRAFILSGGIDPYPDVADAQEHKSSKQQDQAQKERDNSEESVYSVSTTVKAKKVGQWYSSSNAVACLMDTGCFACVEDKVCLNDKKYVGRDQETGNMRLTTYAKAHEEECFLQFVIDNDGNLHYVKLPAAMADKEFKYSDHISDDILKQYGLVNEMSDQMLTAIEKMEFGPALKELMSKRICDYSVRLLHDITGLDTATINNMRKSQNMTQLNVVSACLGIHLPYPVSTAMLELANIIFSMSRGPESNKTYIQLLSTRWASDYEDIYDDLKEQGLQDLIKQPPI